MWISTIVRETANMTTESSTPLIACRHCMTTVDAYQKDDGAPNEWERREGAPAPLGVTWIVAEQAYNLAVYARDAAEVSIRFYRRNDVTRPCATFTLDPRRNRTGPIWHARIPRSDVGDADYYAYCTRPIAPGDVSVLAAEKLLFDPYARSVFMPASFQRVAAQRPGTNEGHAALSKLDECQCAMATERPQRVRHGEDLVIYEMHVRGLTQHESSGVSVEHRGTFSGVVEKIPYLQELGVTAVELMPVFQFDTGDGNYWGYMPTSFFAPHHAYSSQPELCPQRNEFRKMVDALHKAGIEVILDVVYNHTGEGDHRGPVYNLKGLDNRAYYMASGDPHAPYANFSGTGNTLNTAHPVVRRLVVDSLRYWARDMGVDGFRFDLASVFSRNEDGTINVNETPLIAEIETDPALAGVRLIAEPWDAAGAYQLGRSFQGASWMQWNGRYRETLQRFVRGDRGMVPDLMTRLYGSADLFPDDPPLSRRPWQTVNYITAHDGFTLYDLCSWNSKQNWANGFGNTDGGMDFSWNCGWEGDEGLPDDVLQLRKQQVRNFVCLLMLSNGTPMFRMGDEFLQTQQGNNNPFNQDNETTWLDWRRRAEHDDIFRFFQRMIRFRKRHPAVCRSLFWREDVAWYGPAGPVDFSPVSRCLAYFLNGAAVGDDDLYVMINANPDTVTFQIQTADNGRAWRRSIDTNRPAPADISEADGEEVFRGSSCEVAGRSVVVLRRLRSA
jgi:isoamylase